MGTGCGKAAWRDSRIKEEFTLGILSANSSLYAVKNYFLERANILKKGKMIL